MICPNCRFREMSMMTPSRGSCSNCGAESMRMAGIWYFRHLFHRANVRWTQFSPTLPKGAMLSYYFPPSQILDRRPEDSDDLLAGESVIEEEEE